MPASQHGSLSLSHDESAAPRGKGLSTLQKLLGLIDGLYESTTPADVKTLHVAMAYVGLVRSAVSDRSKDGNTTRFDKLQAKPVSYPADTRTVKSVLTRLRADNDDNNAPIPFSSLTIRSFFDSIVQSPGAAERAARELYMAVQKKKLLGDPKLWFLKDDDSEYVAEIERVLRRRIDRLRLDNEKSRVLLAAAGKVTGRSADGHLDWEARFGKRGLVAIVRTDAVKPNTEEEMSQYLSAKSSRANGLEFVAIPNKWEVTVLPSKNLPAQEGELTVDAVMLKQAMLQFRDAISRMKVAFRRGDFYFAIDRPEPAAAAPEAAAAAAAAAPPAARGSPVAVTAPTQAAAASLDELFASHAAATRRVLELLEDV